MEIVKATPEEFGAVNEGLRGPKPSAVHQAALALAIGEVMRVVDHDHGYTHTCKASSIISNMSQRVGRRFAQRHDNGNGKRDLLVMRVK